MKQNRLKLLLCTEETLTAILESDEKLAKHLGVTVPQNWSNIAAPAFKYALKTLQKYPKSAAWGTYLPILIGPDILIGSCGYKGRPDQHASVEIDFEIAEPFRGQGYATEIVQLLVDQAFQDRKVKGVIAHTSSKKSASTRVLEKCHFRMVGELEDPREGTVWQWELSLGV